MNERTADGRTNEQINKRLNAQRVKKKQTTEGMNERLSERVSGGSSELI